MGSYGKQPTLYFYFIIEVLMQCVRYQNLETVVGKNCKKNYSINKNVKMIALN